MLFWELGFKDLDRVFLPKKKKKKKKRKEKKRKEYGLRYFYQLS
jgi:hypothetical protein